MRLTALTESLNYEILQGTMDKDVKSLIYHSDKACPKSAFFAINGNDSDGADYIEKAVALGAEVVFCEGTELKYEPPENVTVIKVDDVRKALSVAGANFFGRPAEKLITIGITGTKGKTTTSFMLRNILEAGGIRTGLIGTVLNGFPGNWQQADHTTPQSLEIQSLLHDMCEAGCKAVVMEVSSQGLMQSRVFGMNFDIGIFTNITPDHIGGGEHSSFSEYLCWKGTLFKNSKVAIMNTDDENWRRVLGDNLPEQLITFGTKKGADYQIKHCRLYRQKDILGVKYSLNGDSVKVPVPGAFNAFNSAAAIVAAQQLNVERSDIMTALADIKIRGRVELVDIKKDFSVFVDYAHNGIALEKLLTGLRQYNPKRLIVVFGCGGNRDRNRRFEMGRAAARYADFTIVTSDNPRREEPLSIIEDIVSAIEKTGGKYIAVPDRAEAIKLAANLGIKGDIIVIAGKGHETYQIIGDKTLHFDDREIIMSIDRGKQNEKINN